MKTPRLELIFELEAEIRRVDREQQVRRWTHAQLLRRLQNQHTRKHQLILRRIKYRLKQLLHWLTKR